MSATTQRQARVARHYRRLARKVLVAVYLLVATTLMLAAMQFAIYNAGYPSRAWLCIAIGLVLLCEAQASWTALRYG